MDAGAPGGGNQTVHSPRHSDIDYELPNGINLGIRTKRDIKMPSPAPVVHDDVLPWHVKLMDIVVITNPDNMEREQKYWGCAYRWEITDPRLKNTKTPKDMLGLEMVIREKITALAQQYGTLGATIKAHSDAWFHATQITMPGRCTLALFYEYFRIEKPVVTIMALQGLYHIRYKDHGDKNLEGFWEAWKEVVRKLGNLVKEDTLAQELVRHLDQSYILKYELAAYKREVPEVDDWKWDSVARIVAQKITDIQIKARTDGQLRAAGIDPGGGFAKGRPSPAAG